MIWNLVLGGVAGFLAGKAMRGNGYGIIVDVLLGLAGGWLGAVVGHILGIHLSGSLGYLITAFGGAVLLVWIVRKVKRG